MSTLNRLNPADCLISPDLNACDQISDLKGWPKLQRSKSVKPDRRMCGYTHRLNDTGNAVFTLPVTFRDNGGAMSDYFDIFERLTEDHSTWVCYVFGRQTALARLEELGARSGSEFYLVNPQTQKVIARVNASKSYGR